MKQIKTFLLMALVVMLTGCYEAEFFIKVNKDKTHVVGYSIKVEETTYKNIMEMGGKEKPGEDIELLDKEEKKELEKKGYTVKDIKDDKYIGVSLEQKRGSIDELTTTEKVKVNLVGSLVTDSEDEEVLKGVKIFNSSDNKTYKSNLVFTPETSDEKDEENSFGDLTNSIKVKFSIQLPNKPLSHNANTVSNDGKTLTWEFDNKVAKNIDFEFNFDGAKNINLTLVFGIVGGLVVLVLILVVINKNKTNNPSFAGQIFEPSTPLPEQNLERPMGNIVPNEKLESTIIKNDPLPGQEPTVDDNLIIEQEPAIQEMVFEKTSPENVRPVEEVQSVIPQEQNIFPEN